MSNVVALKKASEASKRWTVTITHRSVYGSAAVQFDIEELEELQDIVEAGPDWHTIEYIDVRLTNNPMPELTMEQADAL